ncbi:ABC transporter substrate-binding protein [Ruicaihuangia caeni]|uniref:ABC transporter substrate-binding protein n=1 Tax=Ruicaihuangia caeni TaxID=3042517 RepID=A0AAW6T7F0_9MICO|nr:ABC transporter substrate-binding protein [Klugiella sp. YN-L-19]MDI2099742.1 ABC transporter substrate-binding protein [Klugiella sp. YN-L-19]
MSLGLASRRFAPRMAAVAAVAAVGLALTGCAAGSTDSQQGEETESTAIRMATQPWIGYGPWAIADEQGYFDDRGLDVTLTSFDGDAEVNAALASGQADVANVASHTALQFVENGVDVSIILLMDAATTADAIIASGDITTIADLKGQKVAYEEGATSDLLLNYALAENGMSIDDIERVPMGASEAGAALIGNRVPVAVTYEPYITEALAQSDSVHVLYTAAEREGLISDVLVVRNDVLEQKPEALRSLLAAWDDAIGFYNDNTDEGRAIIATAVGAAPEELTTAFDGVEFFTLDDNAELLDGAYLDEALPAIIEAGKVAKILDGSAKPSDVVDSSLLK